MRGVEGVVTRLKTNITSNSVSSVIRKAQESSVFLNPASAVKPSCQFGKPFIPEGAANQQKLAIGTVIAFAGVLLLSRGKKLGSLIAKGINKLKQNKAPVKKAVAPIVNIDAISKTKLRENIESVRTLYKQASACKTRGKTWVILDGKKFNVVSKDKTLTFVNDDFGITITGIQEGGKRKFHILDKSKNTVFNQYEPKKYKIVSREGDFVCEVDTIFGQSIDNVHAQSSAIRTTSGKTIEAAETGRRDYTYNLIDKTLTYDDYLDNVRVRVSKTAEILNPNDIAFSQKTVSEIGFESIKKSMQRFGWTREPINVVKTKDGHLVSIDNRRLRAAAETNTPVHAVVHSENEPLTDSFRAQFFVKNPETKEVVALPTTWGEALYNRLFVNGFVNGRQVFYSKNYPACGKDGIIAEKAMELYNSYKAGKVPYLDVK